MNIKDGYNNSYSSKMDWLEICKRKNIKAMLFADFIKSDNGSINNIINNDPNNANNDQMNESKMDVDDVMKSNSIDYVSMVNHLCKNFSQLPLSYEELNDRKFKCKIQYNNRIFDGIGSSKKEAKQNSCKQLYKDVFAQNCNKENTDNSMDVDTESSSPSLSISTTNSPSKTLPSISQSLSSLVLSTVTASSSSSSNIDPISQLQIFCGRNPQLISVPKYDFIQIDQYHYCKCSLKLLEINNEHSLIGEGKCTSKKNAKKQAAQAVIQLLDNILGTNVKLNKSKINNNNNNNNNVPIPNVKQTKLN